MKVNMENRSLNIFEFRRILAGLVLVVVIYYLHWLYNLPRAVRPLEMPTRVNSYVGYDMTSHLTFLNPDLGTCEHVLELGDPVNKMSEFQYIWDEVEKHTQFVKKTRDAVANIDGKCMEGYSAKYDAEAFVMVKLAQ